MSDNYRVLVIEDDLDVALYTKTVLEKRLDCQVITVSSAPEVLPALRQLDPDVVITDIELPGASGLELMAQIREERPGVPVIVMTAHVSVEYAVSALRNHADEFLTKPVSSADLVSHVTRLAEARRTAAAEAPTRHVVLAIGAHPDDVEIGVGGVLAAHRAAGDEVTILTLSRGNRDGGVQVAWNEGSAAAAVIGATLILEDTPESDITGTEPTVGLIAKVVAKVNPTIVYVHSRSDRSAVHRAVHDATALAAAGVPTVACYQSSTSTPEFLPIRFIPIGDHLDAKLEMLSRYAVNEERKKYLQPEFVTSTAQYWSRFARGKSVEPLEILRDSAEVS